MASSSNSTSGNPMDKAKLPANLVTSLSPVRPEIFYIDLDGLKGNVSQTSTLVPNSPVQPSQETPTQANVKPIANSPTSQGSPVDQLVPKLTNAYLPDSVVSGRLYVKLRQALRVKALRINLYGIEYVRFTQTAPHKEKSAVAASSSPRKSNRRRKQLARDHNGAEEQEPLKSPHSHHHQKQGNSNSHHRRNDGHTYSESHVIFDSEIKFVGLGEDQVVHVLEDYPEIEAGYGVYSFSFKLPHVNLPASFEGEYGCVRYFLKASLELPFGASLPFTTFKPITISSAHPTFLPAFQQPIKREDEHSVCTTRFLCFCCCEGTVFCQVESKAQAYAPGHDVKVGARIVNGSGKDIVGFTLRLIRNTQFMAEGHLRSEMQERISDTVVETRVRSSREVHNFELSLPIPKSTAPSTCHTTQLINVEYHVHVLVHIEGVDHPLKYSFPLLIGSITDGRCEGWIRGLKAAKTNTSSEHVYALGNIYDRKVTAPKKKNGVKSGGSDQFPQTLPLYDASQEVTNMTASMFRHLYN